MFAQHFLGHLGTVFQVPVRRIRFSDEDDHSAFSAKFATSVTPSRCLGYGVQACQSAVNSRKAQIDAGFHELGADDPAWGALLPEFYQSFVNLFENLPPVNRAHVGGEMENEFRNSFLERYLEEHLMESLAMEANYAGCGEKLEHMIQHYIYA